MAVLLTTLPGNSGIVLNTSKALGGTDITDAAGHVVLMAALAAAWYHALRERLGSRRALAAGALLSLALGVSTEFAQAGIADRGASLLDLGANVLGVALASLYLRSKNR